MGYLELPLNESPSEKEGKFVGAMEGLGALALNESPSEKEGKEAGIDVNRPGKNPQ